MSGARQSYGVILARMASNGTSVEFVGIRKPCSIGFSEFARGKYNPENLDFIASLCDDMTEEERKLLQETDNFEADVWSRDPICASFSKERLASSLSKFNRLGKETLCRLIDEANARGAGSKKPKLGFPKGRKSKDDRGSAVRCALREMNEETLIPRHAVDIIPGTFPLCDLFRGMDGRMYRYTFYVATLSSNFADVVEPRLEPRFKEQMQEVAETGWYPYEQWLEHGATHHIKIINQAKEMILCYFRTRDVYMDSALEPRDPPPALGRLKTRDSSDANWRLTLVDSAPISVPLENSKSCV